MNNLTEKDLNKLNQLDRIEFRQKYDRINRGEDSFFYSLRYVSGYVLFLILLGVAGNQMDGFLIKIFSLARTMLLIGIPIIVLSLIFDGYNSLANSKDKKELKEKYFNFKTEVKKKK